jgi:hypothetical protein
MNSRLACASARRARAVEAVSTWARARVFVIARRVLVNECMRECARACTHSLHVRVRVHGQ